MQVFILHADTPYRTYREHIDLTSSALHINEASLSSFAHVYAGFAFWSDRRLSDTEAWCAYRAMRSEFRFSLPPHISNLSVLYAVEDARLLCGDLNRLSVLRRDGICILAPFWKGENILGGGYDTEVSLSPFGIAAVRRAAALGMCIDISHASFRAADELIRMAEDGELSVLATHSACYELCPHLRNLTDAQIRRLIALDSLLGITFVPSHLGEQADISVLLRHIRHILSLGGGRILALGGDLDGTDLLPRGMTDLSSLSLLLAAMRADGIPETEIENICYGNALRWFSSRGILPFSPFLR